MIPFQQSNARDVALEKLFDYAGMFPPASRSFHEALRESASLQSTLNRPWILGADFVLNAEHTRQLLQTDIALAGFSKTISLCLLADESLDTIESLIDTLSVSNSARVVSIESKFSPRHDTEVVHRIIALATKCGALAALEPDLSNEEWSSNLSQTISVIRTLGAPAALKCRCSGPTAANPERLARAIIAAADARLPFKVTGGLHHPIVDPSRPEFPMGFLNVTAAVLFRRALGSDAPEPLLIELLRNSSNTRLQCAEELRFDSLILTRDQTETARALAHFSIGSCSLHEPDEDLIRLFPG